MYYIPSAKMFVNKFVDTQLPTKGQIFDRCGQRTSCGAGSYSGDSPAVIGASQTEKAERFAREAESYVKPEPEDTDGME